MCHISFLGRNKDDTKKKLFPVCRIKRKLNSFFLLLINAFCVTNNHPLYIYFYKIFAAHVWHIVCPLFSIQIEKGFNYFYKIIKNFHLNSFNCGFREWKYVFYEKLLLKVQNLQLWLLVNFVCGCMRKRKT